jgi:serine/threonine protein kinase
MEFVDGPSLAEHKLVQPGRCFEPESLVKWLGQLCSALDYAHRAVHLVHRDLKPLNLLLTSAGGLKVVDFGISRSLGKAETRLSTRACSSGFSLAYAGPQQIMGEPPAVTDDIYSFGATVYELLTGKTPFSDGDLLAQIREVVPPSMADRRVSLGVNARGEIPAAWEAAIADCLAKKAADRPQSAVELAERLRIALPSLPSL